MFSETLESRIVLSATIGNNIGVGNELQNYRLAIAATAEYTGFFGGQTQALAAIETFVSDVNAIFEKELSIHFDLVTGTNTIFTDSATDGYTNGDTNQMLGVNTGILDGVIGNSNYDIGHVFGLASSGGSGLGGLGVVNDPAKKGRGASIFENPQGSDWVRLVAHEFGHQFGAEHTFNGDQYASTVGNRSATSAYEPASGSTLMSYAGIAGPDNLQLDPDPYFHGASFEEIQTLVSTTAPPNSVTPQSNNIPTVSGGVNYTIPAGTPFQLSAVGSDADTGDTLTYTWEQLDLGPAMSLPISDNGLSPLFRSFPPSTDPTRVLPRLDDLINNVNTAAIGEALPTTTRNLNFRATVRDGMGGVNSDDVLISVVNTGAPFAVTSPNTSVSWTGGTSQTIDWNVGGTIGNGINVANVGIDLSLDGGVTYPIVLATSTPNDGSHTLTVPNIDASQARIRVRGLGNIFFDISDADFTIASDSSSPGLTVTESDGSTIVGEGVLTGTSVDTYALALNTTPTGTVQVTVNADAQTEVSLDGSTFSSSVTIAFFDTTPTTVYVRGFDDSVFEGIHTGTITHSITASSDPGYVVGAAINPVVATIADDEAPPLIGVDFGPTGDASPTNWTLVTSEFGSTTSELQNELGISTVVDLTVAVGGGANTGNTNVPTNLPNHSPTLEELEGVRFATTSLTLTWKDLIPGQEYDLWLFLSENYGNTVAQNVTIVGAQTLPTFLMDSNPIGSSLLVNDVVADPARTLSDDAKRAVADASGTIRIDLIKVAGNDYVMLNGAAIQPVVTAPAGNNANLSVTTNGNEQGPVDIVFTVTLDQPNDTGSPITFDFDDLGTGSATSGLDYTAVDAAAQITIANGATSGTLTISVLDDSQSETIETIDAQISNPSEVTINLLTATATAEISDNDLIATLDVQILDAVIGEGAGTAATSVTITRSGDTTDPLELNLKSHDLSEVVIQAIAMIPAGQSSVTVALDAINETYLDGTQTVNITATTAGYSGDITPDTTFGVDGAVATDLDHNISPSIQDIKVQLDGKIITVGRDSTLSDTWNLIRLNPDGSFDSSFGVAGTVTTTFSGLTSVRPGGIILHADGRISVVGRYGGGGLIARYTNTGAPDTTFDGDGKVEIASQLLVTGIAHPDGSLSLIGSKGGNPGNALLRISNDGTVDTTFGIGGVVTEIFDSAANEAFADVVQQSDGKLVVSGRATFTGSNTQVFVARFNLDGSLDSSYGVAGYRLLDVHAPTLKVNAMALAPDGGVVVFGDAFSRSDWMLAKFDSTGAVDTSFANKGYTFLDFEGASDNGMDVLIQDDGKILALGGPFVIGNGNDRGVARFNPNGALDTSFSDDGYAIFSPFTPT
ncbi:MAG: hypothetical protein KDB00_01230, partial [Planctomycetales bacterium]|nr:hypothetical protein [Planctomycetales bacterium]